MTRGGRAATRGRALDLAFYAAPCLEVARGLVGKYLVRRRGSQNLVGRIVETEAYCGLEDRASHASRGRTPRTEIMFGPPGRAYVYLVYGMYHCLNAVCEPEGFPAAVLLRAVEPVAGFEGGADGPGKLCRVMGIDREDNGADLLGGDLWIEDRGEPEPIVVATPRIGVDYAGACAEWPWRFVDPESRHLSRRLRAPG